MTAERAHLNSERAAMLFKICWQKARSCSLSWISCCQAWSWTRWLCAHLCISLACSRSHTSAYARNETQRMLCAWHRNLPGKHTFSQTSTTARPLLQQVTDVRHAGYFAADADEARWLIQHGGSATFPHNLHPGQLEKLSGFGMQVVFGMHRGLTQMAYDSLYSCLPVLQAMAPFPHQAACIRVSRPVSHLHSDTTVLSNFRLHAAYVL